MQSTQQSVIIHFQYGLDTLDSLHDLENELETILEFAKVGFYDGNEINVNLNDGYMFMYGSDAEKIYEVIFPIIKLFPFMNNATVTLHYELPIGGTKEKVFSISF
ncbi:MAG: hypothetical protein KF758_02910 [Anaerolineales bacterium]|nr:hypothetical protein [Anaerolineales bacterium]MBX3035838.1 hypothetical protein [Anaerolineales bacterium]